MVLKDIPVLLPHEWFASMLETDLMDSICGGTKVESFWSQTPLDDPRLFENHMMDNKRVNIQMLKKCFVCNVATLSYFLLPLSPL